jgi:hypothetical protein
VLIGAETALRPWVKYEIQRSLERGNALIGVTIHNITDMRTMSRDVPGPNPFDAISVTGPSPLHALVPLSTMVPVYDWVWNDGYNNFANWVEVAAARGRR